MYGTVHYRTVPVLEQLVQLVSTSISSCARKIPTYRAEMEFVKCTSNFITVRYSTERTIVLVIFRTLFLSKENLVFF